MNKLATKAALSGIGLLLFAQTSNAQLLKDASIHGNFQSDVQYYRSDPAIGAPDVPEKLRTNNFANVIVDANKFSMGFRYEAYLPPLLGFDPRFKGSGVPFRYLNYNDGQLSFTLGNFYEQFGSGLILRSYEERGLGFDNAMDGVRVTYQPKQGIYVKGVYGRMRTFWDISPAVIRGVDAEVSLNDLIPSWAEKETRWLIGGGVVSKYQEDQNPDFVLPQNVSATSARLNVSKGDFNLQAEYATKVNDPGLVNNFIYKNGECLLVTGTYTIKGLGILMSAKRTDNFDLRADRNATGNNLNINFLPALTRQHTYMLAGTIYPYATQPLGEMAFQTELSYNFKKGTKLGGKYGMQVIANFSAVNNIEKTPLNDMNTRRINYKSDFFTPGPNVLFRDFNVEVTKRLSDKVKSTFMYLHLVYDKDRVQGLSGFGTIVSDIAIADITWKLNDKNTLRFEGQHLSTQKDFGSWAMALVEYTYAPHWFVALIDQYNYGNKNSAQQIHYITATTGYNKGTTRIQFTYGRQREGIVCVGGVCRNVPASNGFALMLSNSF